MRGWKSSLCSVDQYGQSLVEKSFHVSQALGFGKENWKTHCEDVVTWDVRDTSPVRLRRRLVHILLQIEALAHLSMRLKHFGRLF